MQELKKIDFSTHKILPANKVDKNNIIIKPLIKSENKKNELSKSSKKLTIDRNKNNIYNNFNNNSNFDYNLNINNTNSKKTYLDSLKDKIFSPGNFQKSESKNQKLIMELNKKLLNYTNIENNNENKKSMTQKKNEILNSLKSNNNQNKLNINSTFNHTSFPSTPSISILKYLPEKSFYAQNKKTLILDLDETLVHSAFKSLYSSNKDDILFTMNFDNKTHTIHVLKRPFVDEFLDKMSKIFELVIFTASIKEYANPLLNKLDTKKRISYRLFREHCTPSGNFFIKDLKKVGRNLKDTILLDNNPISYFMNKENGVPILTWISSKNDNELFKLIPFLEYLSKVDDVRTVIKKCVNGNYVNFNEVNKLIKNEEKKNNNNVNNNNNNNFNNGLNKKFSMDFGINYNNNNNNNNKSLDKKEESKENFFDRNYKLNSNRLNNNENENNNISTFKHVFSNYYFDTKNNNNNLGDKIRKSLYTEFDLIKSNNLLDDKIYKEKYNNFYNIKSNNNNNNSNNNTNNNIINNIKQFNINNNNINKTLFEKKNFKEENKDLNLVLPSNFNNNNNNLSSINGNNTTTNNNNNNKKFFFDFDNNNNKTMTKFEIKLKEKNPYDFILKNKNNNNLINNNNNNNISKSVDKNKYFINHNYNNNNNNFYDNNNNNNLLNNIKIATINLNNNIEKNTNNSNKNLEYSNSLNFLIRNKNISNNNNNISNTNRNLSSFIRDRIKNNNNSSTFSTLNNFF